MHPLLRKFLGLNWLLFGVMVLLGVYGIYSLYSATWMRDLHFYHLQIVWLLVSLPVFFILALTDYHWIRWVAFPLYFLSIACLAATHFGGKVVYGSGRWISLGPVSFQPSTISIIAGIIMLAIFLTRTRDVPPFLRILGSLVIAGTPALLVLLQPDLGSAMVWGVVFMGMLFMAKIPKRYLISMILLTIAAMPVVVSFGLKPYQRERIMTFLNPEADPLNASYNINQSLNAIGAGGLYGKGFKSGNTLNELGFLPKAAVHNDFIFSVMGEQHGFLGGICLLGLYATLLLTSLYIASQADDEFGCLLATGILMMLFAHIFMNLGMTVAVTPVTGLPLPFMSYGGTFLLTVMISMAILQSIWIYRKRFR